jgi:hypothetical protein
MTNFCRRSRSWAPKIYYYFAWLAVLLELQCYAFKPLSQGSTTLSDDLPLRSRCYYSWRRLSPLASLNSIRGGTSDNDIENEYDEDEASYYDFIASFESELAEIRREAELEAENEMKKIRGLIEPRDDDDEHEEEFIQTEYHGGTDGSNENDQYDGFDGNSDVPNEENIEASSGLEETNKSTDEGGLVFHGGESTKQRDIEVYEDKRGKEIVEELNDDKTAIIVDGDLIGGGITESVGASMGDFTSANEKFGSSREMKPKASKTKNKVNKKKKKKVKSRIGLSVESDTDGGRGDIIGGSVLQTRTCESDEDIALTRKSGVWYYLRSDLGRALCLFIATIIVAILTKRLERQMETEGIV